MENELVKQFSELSETAIELLSENKRLQEENDKLTEQNEIMKNKLIQAGIPTDGSSMAFADAIKSVQSIRRK